MRNRRGLTLALLNCRSIRSEAKARDFVMFVREHNPDIILGTESWLSDDVSDAEIFPSDYVTYRKDRIDRSGGGVFISVRENINSYKEEWNSGGACEAVWCRIVDSYQKHYLFGCFYDPPSDCEESLSEFLAVLEEHVQLRTSRVVIGGDFNLPDIDWDKMLNVSGGRYHKKNEMLLNVINTCGLEQMIRVPTRIAPNVSNTLDLLITNVPQLVGNVTTCVGISDHSAVTFELQNISRRPKVKRAVKLFKRANFKEMNDRLFRHYLDFHEVAASQTVNENWVQFKEVIKDVEKLVPTRTVSANADPPWYNQKLRCLDNKQRKLHRRAIRHRCDALLQRYRATRTEVKKAYKEAEISYKNRLGLLLKESDRHFWKYVKSRRGKETGISSILSENGNIIHDAEGIANILNNQYSKVFCDKNGSCIPLAGPRTSHMMPPVEISYRGILGLLERIEIHKACGPDGICGAILKYCAKIAGMFLKTIFEQSLDTGDIPFDWRQAFVHPVFKGGNSKMPGNYRPISLTCICCKLMERIVVSSITTYLDDAGLLAQNQHGFRKRLSCESQLIMLCHDVMSSIDKKTSVDLAFIDFSKAFDKVPHNLLINKLQYYNFDQKVLGWIEAFLKNRTQRVIIENSYSNSIPVTSGVPQGSVLGPILFLLYINDLPDRIGCKVRLYANDVVLYTDVLGIEESNDVLQVSLNELSEWCHEWKMCINVDKSAVMRVSRLKSIITPVYRLNDIKIKVVQDFKYLGVHISNQCSWQKHIQYVASKSSRMLRFIKRNFRDCPQAVKEVVYTSLVRPLLEYASCVWDPCGEGMKRELEMVQRRAARFVLNDYDRTSSVSDMLLKIGWQSLDTRRKQARLCHMFKFYHGDMNVDVSDILCPPCYVGRKDHRKKVRRIQSRILPYHNSFFPKTIRDWNVLSPDAIETQSIKEFKKIIVEK